MKKIKNVRSKKFGFYGYAPPAHLGYSDSASDNVVTLQGQCQALGFKGIGAVFPEKIECTFVLEAMKYQNQETWGIIDEDGAQRDLGHIYQKNTAYDAITWGDPGAVRMMRQGILYPLDGSFSLDMPSKEIRFDVLSSEENRIAAQTAYSYGGMLLNENDSIDDIRGCTVLWAEGTEEMQIVSKIKSVGERVRSGEMTLHVRCKNLQHSHIFSQNSGGDNVLVQQNPEDPVQLVYASYEYRMIDTYRMRVFFFP